MAQPRETLPEEHEETMILSLLGVGETGWTVPWAMWADESGHCWLRGEYLYANALAGTLQMRVEHRTDGVYVGIPSDARYRRDRKQWNGASIPVMGFLGAIARAESEKG